MQKSSSYESYTLERTLDIMQVQEETKFILNKYKIQANKNLGQNFLVNDNVISEIIEAADIGERDLVIEIGPGLGVLTNRLLQNAYKVIAIELDEKMVQIITDRFKLYENLEIINQDILKVDLNKLIYEKRKEAKEKGINIEGVKIVANLPYYISTPIIIKLLEERLNIDSIIVMVQKEVAERLTASPGTRIAGAITYMVDYYTTSKKIIEVEKESFIPSPKVDSEVIELEIRKDSKIKVENEKELFDLIQKSFMQRRKTLVNVLVNYKFVQSKEDAIEILNKLEIDENVRGEALNLEQYSQILENLKK